MMKRRTLVEFSMPTRLILLLVGLGLLTAFFLVNWNTLTTPIPIHLLVFSIAVPAIAIVLGAVSSVLIVGAIYVGIWRRRLLLDYRRQESELRTHRSLADGAEASRFNQLQQSITVQFSQLNQHMSSAVEELRGELRDHERSLAATLGEMDDRLQRETPGELRVTPPKAERLGDRAPNA